jgi:hypothetical protein
MIFAIPTFADPNYTQSVELDGSTYQLSFQYVQRRGSWLLSIADESGNPIATGLLVLANWPLLRRCSHPDRPKGQLVAVSSIGDTPPGLDDFGAGKRVELFYYTADEFA